MAVCKRIKASARTKNPRRHTPRLTAEPNSIQEHQRKTTTNTRTLSPPGKVEVLGREGSPEPKNQPRRGARRKGLGYADTLDFGGGISGSSYAIPSDVRSTARYRDKCRRFVRPEHCYAATLTVCRESWSACREKNRGLR